MKTTSDYFDAITQCMITFQHLEEAMKIVLVRLELLTHHRLKEYNHYDPKPKAQSIRNAAMGRLIEMIKPYIHDEVFISDLKNDLA